MIQKLKVTFLLVTVLAASSCSELEDAVNSNLSTNQITYKVETLNEWNKVESSAKQARTRAAMPASGDVVKRVNGWSGPLYLHALEEPGIHIRDYKDRPVNKQGQLLADENTGRIIATRGSKVTDASLTNFGINVKRVSSDNSAETFIDNEEVKTAVGSKYKTSADHFWPSDNTSLSFYGYYPYNSGNYSSYISVNNTGTTPVVTYKSTAGKTSATATEVKAQPDLCVAVKTGETRPSTSATPDAVNMTFDHALTAITFAVGSDMVPGTFKSITISGVYLEGDYTYDSGWSTANKPTGSITLNLGTDGNGIKRSSKEAVALTGNDSTLLMVPQKVPSDATISMVFDDGKSVNTFTANIGGTEWTAGSTIIYKLSTKAVNNMTLGTISFPDTWKDAGYPKTDYDSGESMGLYSVDDLGNLRAQNVKITYKDKSWTPATSVRFSPAFKYFVYYPYNAEMSSSSVTSTATTAEQFFGKYANTPSADQSTSLSALTSNDLQIGVGTADNTGSSVNFAAANMKHVNGLAKIVLGTKTIPLTRTFYITGINQSSSFSATTGGTTYDSKGIAAYMQYYQGQLVSDPITSTSAYKTGTFTDADGNTHHFVEDSGSRSVKAAANFEGTTNRPYYHSVQSAYYAILKPSSATTFYSKDGIANGWGNRFTSNRVNATVVANNYSSYTAYSDSTFIFLAAAYNFAQNVEKFNAPTSSTFKLDVWGASGNLEGDYQGMTVKSKLGKGGYVSGFVYKKKNQKLYLCIGGIGGATLGTTYNNGSDIELIWAPSGGGATSITTTDRGILKNFESYKEEVLLVGGGGGAVEWNGYGGDGGYPQGGNGTAFQHFLTDSTIGGTGTGGTQSSGGITDYTIPTGGYTKHFNGSFGQGGYGYRTTNSDDYGPQGGGGWYGGGGASYSGAAGGGSSNYNKDEIKNFTYANGVREGDGLAIISWAR